LRPWSQRLCLSCFVIGWNGQDEQENSNRVGLLLGAVVAEGFGFHIAFGAPIIAGMRIEIDREENGHWLNLAKRVNAGSSSRT
jgi:hypothetical protein